MNVALISREYPPDSAWGGIAVTYEKLARMLTVNGHHVHVICQAVTRPEDRVQNGIEVHRVGKRAERYSVLARLDYSVSAWLKLREIRRSRQVDIVCACHWGAEGLLCSLFERLPLIITTHTSAHEILRTRTYAGKKEYVSLHILSMLENFTLRRASRITVSSQDFFSYLKTDLKIKEEKVDVIHYGVDTTMFRPAAVRSGPGIAEGDRTILCIGRLELRKGMHILIKAMREVVKNELHTKLVFLGRDSMTAPDGGSFKRYLIDQAEHSKVADRLVFIETVSTEKLVELYQTCDIYVSASSQESFGNTVTEAMACGKAVICTPTGIAPEIEPFNLKGFSVVPAGDTEKLAAGLMHFLSLDRQELGEIAVQNRELIEREFSLSSWADKMIRVFQKTLKG